MQILTPFQMRGHDHRSGGILQNPPGRAELVKRKCAEIRKLRATGVRVESVEAAHADLILSDNTP